MILSFVIIFKVMRSHPHYSLSRILTSEVIRQLVEERKRQRLTQQELSDITGVRTSNIARFEGGTRIPTLLMLEKYANALGKHIEVRMCDKE